MKKNQEEIVEKIYKNYLNSNGVSGDLKNIKYGNVFFAFNQYKPKKKWGCPR